MPDWRDEARVALARGPVALVSVLATEGSAPRGPGARMLVWADGQSGTIGGGALEWRAAEQARAVLAHPPGTWRVQDYPLGPLLGQCCGGRVRLLVERLETAPDEVGVIALGHHSVERRTGVAGQVSARGPLPDGGAVFADPEDVVRRPVLLFGAGHVGQAIARIMLGLPLLLGWFDVRPEFAAIDGVVTGDADALVACAGEAASDSAVLILTHDHALDYRLTAAALASQAAFVGLIGSATKRARFVARLTVEGIDSARLTCPIGVAGIGGKTPAEIAVATAAQLLILDDN